MTYSTFKKGLKKLLIQVPPNNPIQFLNEHLRVKKKESAIDKFVMNDCKEPNDRMKK
jgi:hypothetical protein